MGDYDVRKLSRRTVLQAGSVLTGAAYLGVWDLSAARADDSLVPPLPGGQADFSFILRRREDFLRLQFDFINATLNESTGMIERIVGSRPIVMVVGFPTQSLHEEALYETTPHLDDQSVPLGSPDPGIDPRPDDPPESPGKLPGEMQSRMAGASRLAFQRDVDSVPFTVDDLLDWGAWAPRLSPFARSASTLSFPGTTAVPAPDRTAIELPWWLLVSPLPAGRWAHFSGLKSNLGRTELWHTGLMEPGADPVPSSPVGSASIRAIWAKDPKFVGYPERTANDADLDPSYGEDDIGTEIGVPFRGPLAPRDRADIVVSSTVGPSGRPGALHRPVPVRTDLLMLTSLGGYLDAFGTWTAGAPDQALTTGTSLESWRHRASLGRDHYVRIVRKGFLYPFGHRASLIKVTERKFATVSIPETVSVGDTTITIATDRRVAYLFQRYFIVVREPVKTYPAVGQDDAGSNWHNPFTSIRITSLTTPAIDEPANDLGTPFDVLQAFTPRIGGIPFRFQMQGTDRAGEVHSFTAAAPFVLVDRAFTAGDMEVLASLYNGYTQFNGNADADLLRDSDLGGAKVFLVDPGLFPAPGDRQPGDPKPEHARATVNELSWAPAPPHNGATIDGSKSHDQPAFYPSISQARLQNEALEGIAGGSFGDPAGAPFRYRQAYVDANGFSGGGGTAGMVFFEHVDAGNATPVDFAANGTDRSGGSINPGFAPTNLNLLKGCGGGDPQAVDNSGQFDPLDFLGDVGKFLGDLVLSYLLRKSSMSSEEDGIELINRREGNTIVTELNFRSLMRSFPDTDAPVFIAGRGLELPAQAGEDGGFPTDAELTVNVVIVTPLSGDAQASYRVFGEVRDFQIRLFGPAPFIQIVFSSASFEVLPGQKPSFNVKLADLFFPKDSPLKMAADIVTAFLADSPFFIDLQPSSVEAGLDLRLPTITLGALQLKNLGIFFSVKIPFLGDPVLVTFGIGSRDKPVAVTYMALGGGFWVTLMLTANGVKGFELGIEVRASLEGSIGPFKAYAEIAVGIIIAIDESNGGECTLTGYFRAKAGVSLVIVSIKIQIEMSLTYVPAQEKATGRVSVLIEVEIVFFSISTSVDYERKFGGGADPVFADVYPPDNPAQLEDGSQAFNEYIDLFAAVPA